MAVLFSGHLPPATRPPTDIDGERGLEVQRVVAEAYLGGGAAERHRLPPARAPSTACSGDRPSPVPPCGTGSSSTRRPCSPQSTTVRMVRRYARTASSAATDQGECPHCPSPSATSRGNHRDCPLNLTAGATSHQASKPRDVTPRGY